MGLTGAIPAGQKIEPGHDALPYDLPASLWVDRHMRDGALLGWSLHIKPLSHGDKDIEIKYVHGGIGVILLDGNEIGRFNQ